MVASAATPLPLLPLLSLLLAALGLLGRASGFALTPPSSSPALLLPGGSSSSRFGSSASSSRRRPISVVSAAASPRSSRLFAASEEPIFDAEVVSDGSVEGESGEMEADSVVVVEEEFSPREEGAKFPGKYFVAGATGFVGSELCKQLIEGGADVIGLSRGGMPDIDAPWVAEVEWVTGNPLYPETYKSAMSGCDAAISCVGGFGQTDAYLRLVNGDCNLKVLEVAKESGVKRFVFISVHDYKLPKPVSNIGYIAGKREVEKEMGELFHDQGYVLRPAFIYGDRKLALPTDEQKKINLPLQRLGSMAENILKMGPFKTIARSGLPFADVAYTQPLSVETVATAAARCAAGSASTDLLGVRFPDQATILDVDAIERLR